MRLFGSVALARSPGAVCIKDCAARAARLRDEPSKEPAIAANARAEPGRNDQRMRTVVPPAVRQ